MMQAAHDVCLLGLLAARERTEADWRRLLGTAGFAVVRLWRDARGIESVIEAELEPVGDGGAGADLHEGSDVSDASVESD